jgi:bifunctional DNA-binding transcriptional regulator/antitoxin component of YhaV-PrlF toxin-antitoxin module
MDEHFVTVGSEGEIEIPTVFCEALGIEGETRVAIRVEEDRIILRVSTEKAEQQH